MIVLFAVAALQLAPQPPVVVPASQGDGPIGQPVWVTRPMIEFPELALQEGVRRGQVTVLCNQTEVGELNGCVIEDETPPDMGFGRAVLRAVSRARTEGGEPRVRFNLNFSLY